ncbi:MAG: hypothetical protein KGH71_00425 [Candidatus Micrarchaeota archaeon]|nr:hypothetical protein [Candidatus Micrarchaeota archaeon]
MNFYVANKQTLDSSLMSVYRQKEIGAPQKEKTILNAGEAVWSQIIAPNFNLSKGLPFMWYENSGFDVLANTLEELRIRKRDTVIHPRNRAVYEANDLYPYSPMNYRLDKQMGDALLLSGILAPAKGKFDPEHLNNYFCSLFEIALQEANIFWALPIILSPGPKDSLENFIIESVEALRSRVVATYEYKTMKTLSFVVDIFNCSAEERVIAEQAITEMSELMTENNPISNPIELYDADLRTISKPGVAAQVVPEIRRHLREIKENLPVYSKTQEQGWGKITYND